MRNAEKIFDYGNLAAVQHFFNNNLLNEQISRPKKSGSHDPDDKKHRILFAQGF